MPGFSIRSVSEGLEIDVEVELIVIAIDILKKKVIMRD